MLAIRALSVDIPLAVRQIHWWYTSLQAFGYMIKRYKNHFFVPVTQRTQTLFEKYRFETVKNQNFR